MAESTGLSTREIVADAEWTISVSIPDDPTNFTAYNRGDDLLDSDFLMAPVNEADYDSETQCMVDHRNNGPKSFYDHFVHQAQEEGAEGPERRRNQQCEASKHAGSSGSASDNTLWSWQ
eukprot:NODE_4811_length_758_cov_35.069111_g4461_i0.p2 GENE.NODE_4811_length_758_cov_35.069111_g4461_i0~~NODE_4811_length_758_cov_35.069111_g4461_i0.p2  ORF type:complete len:119 (+),score=19.70 NODE_4811_length_758_cov_35.069111_g4461_i0:168-524(+)